MPEENPVPTPAPEPTPTPTPEPTTPAPAPAAEPAPAPSVNKPKSSKLPIIITICSLVGIGVIVAVVILVINLNKPKEPTAEDALNKLFNTSDNSGSKGNDSGYELSKLFGNNDDDDDSSTDSDIDWSKLFDDDNDSDYDDDDDDDYDYGSNSKNNSSSKDSSSNSGSSSKNSSSKITSCKNAFDCLEKLDKGYTATEINKITGITGKPSYEGSSTYEWTFSNGDVLKYYISDYSLDIEVEYKKSNYKDSSIDLSGYKTIESDVKAGTVYYKDFVKALKGAEGKLYRKTDYRNGYFWVDGKGGYIEANVDKDTNLVETVFGMLR